MCNFCVIKMEQKVKQKRLTASQLMPPPTRQVAVYMHVCRDSYSDQIIHVCHSLPLKTSQSIITRGKRARPSWSRVEKAVVWISVQFLGKRRG